MDYAKEHPSALLSIFLSAAKVIRSPFHCSMERSSALLSIFLSSAKAIRSPFPFVDQSAWKSDSGTAKKMAGTLAE